MKIPGPHFPDPLPVPEPTGTEIVPLFPLPRLYLFPGTAIPLHIFEPRYRQMVDDLLDRRGRLVLGTVLPGHESDLPGSPPVSTVAGLGEIIQHQKLEDGRYLILVLGLKRVSIREVESDRAYRRVVAEPLEETPAPAEIESDLHDKLVLAVRQCANSEVDIPEEIPLGMLADLLLIQLQARIDAETMLELYARLDVTERARGVLGEHAVRGGSQDAEPDAPED